MLTRSLARAPDRPNYPSRLAPPTVGQEITWDSKLAGFGIRITAAGARSFILNYRTKLGRQRRFTIGNFGDWKTGAARAEANELKKQIDRGGDPLGDIHAGRAAPTRRRPLRPLHCRLSAAQEASTQKTYRQLIEAEIRPASGSLKVAEVTFTNVDRLHRKISSRGKPYRANRCIALLSRMFSHGDPLADAHRQSGQGHRAESGTQAAAISVCGRTRAADGGARQLLRTSRPPISSGCCC